MTGWLSAVSNPEVLSHYKDAPSLGNVELRSIGYSKGMEQFNVELALRELPISNPTGWPNNFTSVALTLQFQEHLGVQLATITPYRSPLNVWCELKKHKDGVIVFECREQGINITVESRKAHIVALNPLFEDQLQSKGITPDGN